MNLGELKAAIEAEALRRQVQQGGFTFEAMQEFLGGDITLPQELRAGLPPVPSPLTFHYFESLNGRMLVNACYVTLLGRSPDAGGMNHWVKLLGEGVDKALVVGSIAYSGEGRQKGVRVRGLLWRFAIAAAQRVPVAGAIAGWFFALLTVSVREREARAAEQRLSARMDLLSEHVARSHTHVVQHVQALRSVLEKTRDDA